MNISGGYDHPDYAGSLSEFGEPFELKRCGGWILKRSIPELPYRDGLGCYPLFACRDWQLLPSDLADLQDELITLSMVTDPFAKVDQDYLQTCFDIVQPFKNHYVLEFDQSWEGSIDRRHRQKIRHSLKDLSIEISDDPPSFLDEWTKLYDQLIQRHNITGIRAFSRESFRKQLGIPGAVLVVGKLQGEVVGANLVLTNNDVSYDHLAAYSPASYKANAAYGIFWITFKHLAERGIRYCDLGAATGLESDARDGLDQFKRGWTRNRMPTYFCGRIYNPAVYETICRQKEIPETNYFPAYRVGEFA